MQTAWATLLVLVCLIEKSEEMGWLDPAFPYYPPPHNSPVLATSQGSTIVSPVINLNVSERDMNMGSFLVIMLWADTAMDRRRDRILISNAFWYFRTKI